MLKRVSKINGKIVRYANSINALADKGEDLTSAFPNLMKRLGSVQPITLDPDKYFYTRNRAVSAYEVHGLNDNGDGFEREELQKHYATFINCPSTVDHVFEDQVGMIVDSVYIPFKGVFRPSEGKFISADRKDSEPGDIMVGDWVENIHALDREICARNHPELIPGIENGEITDTSMGCWAKYAVCTVCGNVAHSEDQFCSCVRNSKGRKIVKAGTEEEMIAGEINKDVNFFEDTFVLPLELQGKAGGAGADRGAKVLQIVSSLKPYIITRAGDDKDEDKEIEKEEKNSEDKEATEEKADTLGGMPAELKDKMEDLKDKKEQKVDDREEKSEEVSDEAADTVEKGNAFKGVMEALSKAMETIKNLMGKSKDSDKIEPKEDVKIEPKKEQPAEEIEIGGSKKTAQNIKLEYFKHKKAAKLASYKVERMLERKSAQEDWDKEEMWGDSSWWADQLGDVETMGWFALVIDAPNGKSYILSQDDQGFKDEEEYDSEVEARERWLVIEGRYESFNEEVEASVRASIKRAVGGFEVGDKVRNVMGDEGTITKVYNNDDLVLVRDSSGEEQSWRTTQITKI